MLEIKSFCFGPFQTNTYVINDGQQVLLIDPACSSPYEQQQLLRYIEKLQIFKSSNFQILATHGHLDHLWGASWATKQWNTPVLMHEDDIAMAQAMQQQYDLFGICRKAEPFPIENLQSQIFKSSNLQTLHTSGHTPGSICLYFPEDKVLFSGDTLFRMGYGRTDLPGGNYGRLMDSLDRLLALPSDVRVYPGHGEFTTIAAEKCLY